MIETTKDFAPIGLVNAARATWPDKKWPHWYLYSGEKGDKYAIKDASRLPTACHQLIQMMSAIQMPDKSCFPDLDLHGAGLHWIQKGGSLPLHRDAKRHPLTGWTRRFNAILFLDDCDGGELVFRDNDGNEIDGIAPKINTLVSFPVNEPHEVLEVFCGQRRTISLFWWDESDSPSAATSAEWL